MPENMMVAPTTATFTPVALQIKQGMLKEASIRAASMESSEGIWDIEDIPKPLVRTYK